MDKIFLDILQNPRLDNLNYKLDELLKNDIKNSKIIIQIKQFIKDNIYNIKMLLKDNYKDYEKCFTIEQKFKYLENFIKEDNKIYNDYIKILNEYKEIKEIDKDIKQIILNKYEFDFIYGLKTLYLNNFKNKKDEEEIKQD